MISESKQVHILNESRGSTLEVVTSRMKLRQPSVRFLLVSATVPNIHDVALWIGHGCGKTDPAKAFEVCVCRAADYPHLCSITLSLVMITGHAS